MDKRKAFKKGGGCMTQLLELLMASLAAVTLENVIFTTAFGTSTLIELTKRNWQILSFGGFITEFAVLSSLIAYFLEGLLISLGLGLRLMPIGYIISLGAVYILTLIGIRAASKKAFSAMKRYIHLSAFNCAVLSVLFTNSVNGSSLLDRLLFAAYTGLGFMLAAYILRINYDRLSSDRVPAAFRGFPIYALYIGLVSMIIYILKR